jgi:hypothetical protein
MWSAPMTRPVKGKLATLDQLDGRTAADEQALAVISSIESDLGGPESISTARRALIENAAVLGAVVQDMGAKWISGGQVDLNLYSTLSGYVSSRNSTAMKQSWMRGYYRSLRRLKSNCCYESKSLA